MNTTLTRQAEPKMTSHFEKLKIRKGRVINEEMNHSVKPSLTAEKLNESKTEIISETKTMNSVPKLTKSQIKNRRNRAKRKNEAASKKRDEDAEAFTHYICDECCFKDNKLEIKDKIITHEKMDELATKTELKFIADKFYKLVCLSENLPQEKERAIISACIGDETEAAPIKELAKQWNKTLHGGRNASFKRIFPSELRDSSREGKGVFATRNIKKDEMICWYHGMLSSGGESSTQTLNTLRYAGYCSHSQSVNIKGKEYSLIGYANGEELEEGGIAQYCNDATTEYINDCDGGTPSVKGNAIMGGSGMMADKSLFPMMAVRDIKKDEEILYNYGEGYWANGRSDTGVCAVIYGEMDNKIHRYTKKLLLDMAWRTSALPDKVPEHLKRVVLSIGYEILRDTYKDRDSAVFMKSCSIKAIALRCLIIKSIYKDSWTEAGEDEESKIYAALVAMAPQLCELADHLLA